MSPFFGTALPLAQDAPRLSWRAEQTMLRLRAVTGIGDDEAKAVVDSEMRRPDVFLDRLEVIERMIVAACYGGACTIETPDDRERWMLDRSLRWWSMPEIDRVLDEMQALYPGVYVADVLMQVSRALRVDR